MFPHRLRPLVPYLKRYRMGLLWGGISVLLSNGFWILFPLVIGRAVDDMQHGVTRTKILHYALLLLAIAALKGIFLFLTRWILIGVSRDIEFDLRNDLFANLERQPQSFYHTHRTGDIMARTTNDLNAVRQLLGPAIMYSANTVAFTVGALFFMLRISPWLTLCAFVPLPIASVLVQYFGSRIHHRFERIQSMFSDISAKAQENFSGARLIRAFAQEEAEIHSFEHANDEYIARSLHLVRLMGMLWPTLEFVLGLSLVLTLLVGGREVILHHIDTGNFVAFTTYMVQLTWPMIALGWVVNLFQRGTASVVRIDELLKQQPAIWDNEVDAQSELLLYRRRRQSCRGAAPHQPQHSRRQQSCDRRADRIGQVDTCRPDPAPARGCRELPLHRWPQHPRLSAGGSAPQHRLRAAGDVPIQRLHPRECALRCSRCHRGRHSARHHRCAHRQ